MGAANPVMTKGRKGPQLHARTEIFRRVVRNHMGAKPVEVARTATIGEAMNSMTRSASPAVIVTDVRGKPAGIVTEQDVVRRIALRATPGQSVETVMTTPVATL